MSRLARTAARLVTGAAVVASLVAAQSPAVADGTTVSISIGSSGPAASATVGDPVATVRGAIEGTTLDLAQCEVSGFDPAAMALGAATTVTISGCAGSDLSFVLDTEDGGTGGGAMLKAHVSGQPVFLGLWCEWDYSYGIPPFWNCWYRWATS